MLSTTLPPLPSEGVNSGFYAPQHIGQRETRPRLSLSRVRAPLAGANTRLQQLLEYSGSKKGHNFVEQIRLHVPLLLVWVPLLIVKTSLSFK